nr:VWA domain-containing protein [uncultured Cardiobacterium sp.]
MRRLPIYICIDTSGSMRGEPIKMVYKGLTMLGTRLRQDPYMLETAYLSIITYNVHARETVPLTELMEFPFTTQEFTCSGASCLGAALEFVVQSVRRNCIRSTTEIRGDWIPDLLIFTDGKPSDSFAYQAMIPTIQMLFEEIRIFTVGQKADLVALQQLTDAIIPLETATTTDLYQGYISYGSIKSNIIHRLYS